MKNSRQGLTLVEIIVAIGVFSIIMLALSGTIVSGLKLRRNNTVESQALAYAASVLEQYKSFWADYDNYRCFTPDGPGPNPNKDKCPAPSYWPDIPVLPAIFKETVTTPAVETFCINRDGSVVAKTECLKKEFTPALRRVVVTLRDQQDKVIASLLTEIGNPIP